MEVGGWGGKKAITILLLDLIQKLSGSFLKLFSLSFLIIFLLLFSVLHQHWFGLFYS